MARKALKDSENGSNGLLDELPGVGKKTAKRFEKRQLAENVCNGQQPKQIVHYDDHKSSDAKPCYYLPRMSARQQVLILSDMRFITNLMNKAVLIISLL